MKTSITVLSILLTGVIVLFMGYEHSRAEATEDGPLPNIGVVSIRKVFRDCKRSIKFRTEVTAEQSKIREELDELSKEIEADEAALRTFKPGSSDHLAQIKSLLEKRAQLEARSEYIKQQANLRDRQWTEQLYKEILETTRELAEQKGLELVFEYTEPEFPISSEELMLTISTHKVLYSGNCTDLTDEVIARLDAVGNSEQ
jgi:Skp family chaperone for outer membrane proteins